MRGAWWVLVIGIGCGGKDTAAPQDEGFAEESVIAHELFDSCDPNTYWPEVVFSVLIDGFPVQQAPPYEIRSVEVGMFQSEGVAFGRDCTGTAGLKVQLWVTQQTPDVAADVSSGFPEFPAGAEATVTAEIAEGDFGTGIAVFDPPVLVEEPGTLWVGMVSQFDREGPATEAACLAGCDDLGETVYQWTSTEGWVGPQRSLPLFRVTIGHD